MISFLKRISAAGLLAACLTFFTASAVAQDSPVLDRVMKSGQLRVGMSGNQPPFNVKSRSGALIGLDVDLANAIAAGMRVKLEIVEKPFGELLGALKSGEVDMVVSGMAITSERSQSFSFAGPYSMAGKSILTRSDSLAGSASADQVNNENIALAALENSTSQKYVETILPKAKLVTVKNYDEAVQMLMDGKIDALVADMPICVLTILRNPDAGFRTLRRPFTIEPVGIAVPAGDAQFLNLVDNFVGAIERLGALEGLHKKWMEDSSWVIALP